MIEQGQQPYRTVAAPLHFPAMDPIFLAGTGLVVLGLVVWIVCVVAAYQNAPRRGRSAINWAILTVIFGPLALFALFAMAPKRGGR
jgi:hypothetical protein